MKFLLNVLQKFWWVGAILVLVTTIAFTNHVANTTMSGWDTLHPEFDLAGYASRLVNGAWQQHQGLGAPPSQAHAAELVRLPILWVMSLIMPLNLLRYVFLFLMIFIGCIGVAVFVNSLSISKTKSNLAGFMAAVFYFLSLVSVQQFYVPLEMFAVHYAVVPWVMYCLYNLMVFGDRKWTLWFVLLSIFGAPQAHTATLYYVLVGLMGIFVVVMAIGTWSVEKFWRGVVAIILGIVVNLYWIGPNVFYLVTRGKEVAQSKIHYEFTPEAVLQNQAYGKIEDIAIGRNFLFNWFDYSFSEKKFIPLLDLWHKNFDSPIVSIIMYVLATISLLGLFWITIRKGKYRALGWSSLILLLTTVFFLINENSPTGYLFKFLIEKFPIIGEGLRFPFTKFSIFYLFLMAIGFGATIKYLLGGIKWRLVKLLIVLGLLFCFGFAYRPAFVGGYVSRNMQVEIPKEYFKLFEFMKTQDMNKRIALMPVPNYWGWTYNDWIEYDYSNGYQGAGFLWFGLRQPLLNREFDRWSVFNEDFYHIFSNEIYQGDYLEIGNVLNKYDVNYILLDESVINPGQDKEILRIEETKKIAVELGWVEKFHEGFLTVWDTGITNGNQFVGVPSRYTLVGGDSNKVRKDVIYDDVGTYVTSNNSSEMQSRYPFGSLMREEIKGVEYGGDALIIKSEDTYDQGMITIPGWKVGDIVRIEYVSGEPRPAYLINGVEGPRFLGKETPEDGKSYLVARVSDVDAWSEYLHDRTFELQGSVIKVEVPGEPHIYDLATAGQQTIGNCDVLKRGYVEKKSQMGQTQYSADARGAACDYALMKDLDPRLSYLMRLQGENVEGRSLKYFLYNSGSKRTDIEYLLGRSKFDQTFGLLPWEWDGFYTLNIETRSFGQKAQNIIDPVEVRWFPLEQIARAKIFPNSKLSSSPTDNKLQVTEVKKTGTWLYRVKVEGSGLLKLSQGYDEGWISPGLAHVKVDGWANGWIVPGSGLATIFYWPQLLEYLGFGILGITLIALVFYRK